MALPGQLYNDISRDLICALRIDGELFSKKYRRRPFYSLVQTPENLNIYSEPVAGKQRFLAALSVPLRLQLKPEEDLLKKYGISTDRDALAIFCRFLMETQFTTVPKIGDRIDHVYEDPHGEVIYREQYEILQVHLTDMWRDSGYAMRLLAECKKTTRPMTSGT